MDPILAFFNGMLILILIFQIGSPLYRFIHGTGTGSSVSRGRSAAAGGGAATGTASTGGTAPVVRARGSKRSSSRSSSGIELRERDAGFEDPKDSEFFLKRKGWRKIQDSPPAYGGFYEANGSRWRGSLREKPSGARVFLIKEPPASLKRSKETHHGRCLVHQGDGWFEVHFYEDRTPDAWGDGIWRIESMLEEHT